MKNPKAKLRNLVSGVKLSGKVRVPGDKSISHRALLFGAICQGQTVIEGMLPAEDPVSTANCLRYMGVRISEIEQGEIVKIEGVGLNGLNEPEVILDCGNSGTTMRLLLGLLAGEENKHFVLTGDKSLKGRPMNRVSQSLRLMGAEINGRENGNLAPLSIAGKKLHGGFIATPVASAQVKSAIILAALNAEGGTKVIEPAHSRDHSERMLKALGANISIIGEMGRHIEVRPGNKLIGQKIIVPGDISSAAFWIIAALIIPFSELLIENVGLNPTRTGILEVADKMKASIEILNKKDIAGEPVGDLLVKHTKELKAFTISNELIPSLVDEIPILAVAACFCDGESHISGASELRVKETDRLAVMTRQLKRLGAKVEETPDGLIIQGNQKLKGNTLDSETDHRVAMSLAIAATLAEGNSTLANSEAANVSYPDFWSELERLSN